MSARVSNVWRGARLSQWKARAAAALEEHERELLSMNCGIALAYEINPRLRAAKNRFNETMDKIAALDPTCPKERL